jgi:excisionase family DNA binding protein
MTNTGLLDLRDTVTVHEAAKISDRHPETIKRWIREGRLPAKKVGLVWFINPVDLKTL